MRGPVAMATVHGWGLGVPYMYVLVQMCVCVYVWLKLHTPMLCVSAVVMVVVSYSLQWFPPPLQLRPLAEMFTMAINGLWAR